MTIRYVDGANGNNAWDGLAKNWVSGTNGPKATLNGVEDTPVVAGDVVYVRQGTYRETLTVDVSGTSGNPISYIGDITGAIWGDPFGLVRVTGSDNDQTATRTNCIVASGRNYRTFRGLLFDLSTAALIDLTSCVTPTIDRCVLTSPGTHCLTCIGPSQATLAVTNSVLRGKINTNAGVRMSHSATLDNVGHLIESCLIWPADQGYGVESVRIGGITVRNCTIVGGGFGVRNSNALTAGQTVAVNNCILFGCSTAVRAQALGEIVEDYNSFFANATDRTNVSVGAHSNSYPPLFDARPWLQLMFATASARLASPFDLASYSPLVNVAGSSPPAADLRGNTVQGAQREWGALEYDPALGIAAGGGAGSVFGGVVVR